MIVKKKIETSKKLAWFSGICFAIALVYSITIFTYSIVTDKGCDFGVLLTLVTTTGAAFATTMGFYYNKSRYENVIKEQHKFLKAKYLILKDVHLLDECRVQVELDNELSKIETIADTETSTINQEIDCNE
jgi:hypothetical protein